MLDCINLEWRYDRANNRMVHNNNILGDEADESRECRTVRILREVADSLEENIQFTTDSPENHPGGRMPVLDLKVWIGIVGEKPVMFHTFYKKEVVLRYIKRSAMSMAVKRNTLIQEALRRLRNVSPLILWEEVIPPMVEFANMLRILGVF